MAADLTKLKPMFRDKVTELLGNCQKRGVIMVPFYTLRDVRDQAKLWRQSRTSEQVNFAIAKLRNEGAPWLAGILESVGPSYGRWATNSLPGQSWHQFGEAIDCFVRADNGTAVWASENNGYATYAEEAKKIGLTSGYYWTRKDAVHVQWRADSVRSAYTWAQIDQVMKVEFA